MVPASVVLVVNTTVGFAEVLQQTPLAVTVDPPSLVTFPPLLPDVIVTAVTSIVVRVGRIAAAVVKEISLPKT